MARLFDDSEEYADESMLAIQEISNLCLLERHGCFTVAQCTALLCLHNATDRSDGSDEDMGTYLMLAFNDIRLGKLQALHPKTLLPWREYLEMLKAGMYCDDIKELFPMVTAGWLVRFNETERWYHSKGFDIDLSSVKSDLDGLKAKNVLATESAPDSDKATRCTSGKEIKPFIAYLRTRKGRERDGFFRPVLLAIEETNCFNSRDIFQKLKEFAINGKFQLESNQCDAGYLLLPEDGSKRTKLHRDDLIKRLKRIESEYNLWKQSPISSVDCSIEVN